MIRVGISGIAWDPPQDDEVAAVLRGHGLDCVDLAPGKYVSIGHATKNELAGVRRNWERRGFEITGMQSLLFGTRGLAVFGSRVESDALLEHLDRVCFIGARLGATRLVFGSPRNRLVGDLDEASVVARYRDVFGRAGDTAARYGVRIMLEPNPRAYGADFMVDTLSAAAVVADLRHPAIGLQLDLGACAMNDEDVSTLLPVVKNAVGHIHVSAPNLAPLTASAFLTGALPHVAKFLPGQVACIEMLTVNSALDEIDNAVGFVVSALKGDA